MIELWQKIVSALGVVVAGAAALGLAVMAFLLRRRTRELQEARLEGMEATHAARNEKHEADIAALKTKVDANEKDAVTKARLLRSLLDDGRDDSGRGR